MTEEVLITTEVPVKKEYSPEQIMAKNIRTMPDKQMGRRLNRLERTKTSITDALWAIILSTVFKNTKPSGLGGKLEPFLR